MDKEGNRILLIQGPPGTGKTDTIVGAILKILHSNPSGKDHIIVCT